MQTERERENVGPPVTTHSLIRPHLCELPGDADGPAQAVAPDEQGLHTPAPEVAEGKDVKMAHDSLPGDDMAVDSIFLQRAVQTISLKRSIISLVANTTDAQGLTRRRPPLCRPPSWRSAGLGPAST